MTKIAALFNLFIQAFNRAKQVKQLLDQEQYDMLFIETLEDVLLLTYLPKRYFDNLLVRVHATEETEGFIYKNNMLSKLKVFFLKSSVMKKLQYICATNSYHVNFVKEHYLEKNVFEISKKTFFTLPNTIYDRNNILKTNAKRHANKKIKVLTLGRMNRDGFLQKGFDDFINGLILSKEEVFDRIDLTIVGSGEYQEFLKEKAKKNNLNINFISSITHEESIELLLQNDVVVLLSRFEGHSMFALEALATRNAVLFSNTGGLIDMVEENGKLVEVQDIDDFVLKFEKIILSGDEKIEQMKEASYRLYLKKFSNASISQRFEKFMKIMDGNR